MVTQRWGGATDGYRGGVAGRGRAGAAIAGIAWTVLAASACASTDPIDPGGVPDPAVAIATEVSSELLAPLEAFGPCPDAPLAEADADEVPGPALPPGTVVTVLRVDGPLTHVEGWVPLTPIGVRAHYVTGDGFDVEYSVLNVEDEVFESETLMTDGRSRMFLKAQAVCRTASAFVAQVIPEDGSAPAPLGQQGG